RLALTLYGVSQSLSHGARNASQRDGRSHEGHVDTGGEFMKAAFLVGVCYDKSKDSGHSRQFATSINVSKFLFSERSYGQTHTEPPLSASQGTALRPLYDPTTTATLHLHSLMVLLVHQGHVAVEIVTIMFRGCDPVEGVLSRLLQGGLAALPPHTAPGMAPTVTPACVATLRRAIDRDLHTVGVRNAHGTTGLVATDRASTTQMPVTTETVRWSPRAAGYGCQRSTWTL